MVNSVADQYLVRVGGAISIPKMRHLSGSLAFRVEGLRRYDMFRRADTVRGRSAALAPTDVWVRRTGCSFLMGTGVPVAAPVRVSEA